MCDRMKERTLSLNRSLQNSFSNVINRFYSRPVEAAPTLPWHRPHLGGMRGSSDGSPGLAGQGGERQGAAGSPTASLRQSPKWRPHRHRPLGVGGSPPAVTLPRSPQRYPTAARLLLVLLKLTPPGCKLRQQHVKEQATGT